MAAPINDEPAPERAPRVLDTARLTLRRIEDGDADFICVLLSEPSFIRYLGDRGVRTPEAARKYIRDGPLASYRRHGFGLWLVQLNPRGIPIGVCGLVKRHGIDDVDIGFAFLPAFWSRGYASEAAAAVLDYARSTLGLSRIVGLVTPRNGASIRVLEKLGLRFEKLIRLPGEDHELQLFASDGDAP